MKKFLVLLVMILMITSSCLAMTFSQPVEIGGIAWNQVGKSGGGLNFRNESKNEGSYYTKYAQNNRESYGKGIVQWGTGENTLYVHYDAYSHTTKFGGKNINNTVTVNLLPSTNSIYKITSDAGIVIYPIWHVYNPYGPYTIIGRQKDGKWIKYIETNEVLKKYIGNNNNSSLGKIRTDNSTIIIPYEIEIYERVDGRDVRKIREKGEFRFRWNDAAQWFGVEHVVY